MLTWCAILFILGILAFLDALVNPPFGDIFRKVNSLLFMLISLGMLIRLRAERSQRKVKSSVPKTKSEESTYGAETKEWETPIQKQDRKEPSRTIGVEN